MKFSILKLARFAVILAATPAALATTWYVNGVSGSDSNNCLSASTPCKTIKHAILRAHSGDSIMVAPATYTENLTISVSLNVIGSGAATTIIDAGGVNCPARLSITSCRVVTISATTATLSGLTIRNGSPSWQGPALPVGNGGGIYNSKGRLTINNSTVSGNVANVGHCTTFNSETDCFGRSGGGIYSGTLTINNSTISKNVATTCRTGGAIALLSSSRRRHLQQWQADHQQQYRQRGHRFE